MNYSKSLLSFLLFFSIAANTFGQKFKISGVYDYEVRNYCNCPEDYMQGYLTYYYNDEKKLINICTPALSIEKGSEVVLEGEFVTGNCDGNYLLFVGDFLPKMPLYTGVYESKSFKCPIANEGKMYFSNGVTLDVTMPNKIENGSNIKATEAAWGIKYCDGKRFQIYKVLDYTYSETKNLTNKSSDNEILELQGNFRSVKGAMDPASTLGYNVGYFTPSKASSNYEKTFIISFDRMSNSEDIDVSGNCRIRGYFEKVKGTEVFFVTWYK